MSLNMDHDQIMAIFKKLTTSALDVLEDLFLNGPCHGEDLISKKGAKELIHAYLCDQIEGWHYLNTAGVIAAANATGLRHDVSRRKWYAKMHGLQQDQ